MPDKAVHGSAARPLVAVIGCGGTISCAAGRLDVMDYPEQGRRLDIAEVLAAVPECETVARIAPYAFRASGSSSFGPAEWVGVRDVALQAAATGVAGIVILHGTATLEETAWFLHVSMGLDIPVVMVGSQRPLTTLSSDAGMNLVSALRVAASPQACGQGVLVVANDEIHSARDVVKTMNYRLHTFQSPGYGPLGYVEGDGVHLHRRNVYPAGGGDSRRSLAQDFAKLLAQDPAARALPRVDILYSYAGADGALIEAACQAGARGLVSAGLAPGLMGPDERVAFRAAVERGVAVVQTSRAHHGYIPDRDYLRGARLIPGGALTPAKCRVLLMLGLANGLGSAQMRELFAAQ